MIVQLGGQTPLQLGAHAAAGGLRRSWGTSPDAIDLAEDRGKFARLLAELGIPAPPHGEAPHLEEARAIAGRIGYPVVVRPSYVLGGRAMEIVYDAEDLEASCRRPRAGLARSPGPDRPVPGGRDRGRRRRGGRRHGEVFIGAVMEHIEEAGVHSGDSSCAIPPPTLSDEELDVIEDITRRLARRARRPRPAEPPARRQGRAHLGARGQPARLAHGAVRLEGDRRLARAGSPRWCSRAGRWLDLRADGVLPADPHHYRHLPYASVKAAVLPFGRFPGVDTVLGPEMKSTGEVMGIDADSGRRAGEGARRRRSGAARARAPCS